MTKKKELLKDAPKVENKPKSFVLTITQAADGSFDTKAEGNGIPSLEVAAMLHVIQLEVLGFKRN